MSASELQIVADDDTPHLAHLVCLGITTIALEIQHVPHAWPAKDVMVPANAFRESERKKEGSQ
jgi:hypothetical protein